MMLRNRALMTVGTLLVVGLSVVTTQNAAFAAGSGAEMYFLNSNDSGHVAIHNAMRGSNYEVMGEQRLTAQVAVPGDRFSRAIGDFNGDGKNDLYILDRNDQGRTSVHVLDGATNFQSYLRHTWTPAPATPVGRYELLLGDRDGDNRSDLFIIDRGDNGNTSVHILMAHNDYGVVNMSNRTVFGETMAPTWNFGIGDYDGDGIADIYAINDADGAWTSAHVLRGATQYQDYGIQTYTALHAATEAKWKFRVGDYDGDGRSDIYAINTSSNGRTDVHVLGASSLSSSLPFQDFLLHAVTAIHDTSAPNWDVQVGLSRPISAIDLPVDSEASVESDDVPTDDPPSKMVLPTPRRGGKWFTERDGNQVGIFATGDAARRTDFWDQACRGEQSRYAIVADYPRVKRTSRMVGSYARMYCGKEDRYSEAPFTEAGFGLRHIRDWKEHSNEFAVLGAFEDQSWGAWMHTALRYTFLDPDLVTDQNAYSTQNRYCYEKEFVYKIDRRVTERVWVVVITGKTGRRIMTTYPRDYPNGCSGPSV